MRTIWYGELHDRAYGILAYGILHFIYQAIFFYIGID